MRNALLLGGGGSRGAIEVGFYKALSELHVPINLIFGTSVGALNGAFIAAGATPEELQGFGTGWRKSGCFAVTGGSCGNGGGPRVSIGRMG